MSNIITPDNTYYLNLTDIEMEIVLALHGDTLIDDPSIIGIISDDSANKLKLKDITTWFQIIGIAMTLRSINTNTGKLISDYKWFNLMCSYLNTLDINNPEIITYAAISYLEAHMFAPIPV
jgi:hypothetical protein